MERQRTIKLLGVWLDEDGGWKTNWRRSLQLTKQIPPIYVVFEEMVRLKKKNGSPTVLLDIREGENSQRLFKHSHMGFSLSNDINGSILYSN